MTFPLSVVRRVPYALPFAIFRVQEEFGFVTADLASPPSRLLVPDASLPNLISQGVDCKRIDPAATPAKLMQQLPDGDNWSAQTKRTIARILAGFLVGEDPQRRLDARDVSTLSHQVSLVRHVLDNSNLRRVLIADEVGLGKTVEAGLILKELLDRSPNSRVLYLAPARLVTNVRREFDRMKLGFRQWSSIDGDARLSDNRIIASIHRAVHGRHAAAILETEPWDIIVVDECHHLSDWAFGGGDPREKFKLVRDLLARQPATGRVLLLSGTPHQGHRSRFENLIGLLCGRNELAESVSGRVIYRTKDDVRDWDGSPLFPRRDVKEPIVVDLGPKYREWITRIHDFFRPKGFEGESQSGRKRAAGWRCAQALQWAASSPQAGVGYLVRQALRAGWDLGNPVLKSSIALLRPYRGGKSDEPIDALFRRMVREIANQDADSDVIEDIEDFIEDDVNRENCELQELLSEGLEILESSADVKWRVISERIIKPAQDEKIVFFAQPIETVTAFAKFLERETGNAVALIIGGQSDAEREAQVQSFVKPDGPQYLVSSRAGGEGINLQISRRLVHIDVPWNPMDMEQRVGRVHRFGSRKTIIVETLVVKDSREEHAYSVARDKLRSITATMVEPDRFEQVFSRVMSLVPPEELTNVLANSPLAPLTPGDQEKIARVVREGFSAWQEFDRRFAESQRQIRTQEPGLASWGDLEAFLINVGKWSYADGFAKHRFTWLDGELETVDVASTVLKSPDNLYFACSDQGGQPVFGPQQQRAEQLGLNLPAVRSLLQAAAFPSIACGAFYVRWTSEKPPLLQGMTRVAVFVLLRQTVRTDQHVGWSEAGLTFHAFLCEPNGRAIPVSGLALRDLIRGLQSATPRVKAPSVEGNDSEMMRIEQDLIHSLRRPSDEELARGVRHVVWPFACGIIDLD